MAKYISVGKILNFHGINGDVKVGFSKNRQDFLSSLKEVLIEDTNNYTKLKISSIKIVKNFAIIKFKDYNDINSILPFKGKLIYADEQIIREKLGKDEYLTDELVGLNIEDREGKPLGFVVGISNNGAQDLLSVKTKSKKICLIPLVDAIVLNVDLKNKRITINNIEGLLE